MAGDDDDDSTFSASSSNGSDDSDDDDDSTDDSTDDKPKSKPGSSTKSGKSGGFDDSGAVLFTAASSNKPVPSSSSVAASHPTTKPDQLESCFQQNGTSTGRHFLQLLKSQHDRTILDPNDAEAKQYTLINFHEFAELSKGNAGIIRRMDSNPSGEQVEKERLRMVDLQSALTTECKSVVRALMLEEARRLWRNMGRPEPVNFDNIRKNWVRDCSYQTAEATWQVLYGLFDRLDQLNRRHLTWDKRFEIMLMEKFKVAYINSSVEYGNPRGGPKPTGCVQQLVNRVKQETVKTVQRAGNAAHGHSLVLKMPKFAVKRGDKAGHRQPGKMEYYMFYESGTESFPSLEQGGGSQGGSQQGPDPEDGDVLLQADDSAIVKAMRKRLEEQQKELEFYKQNGKVILLLFLLFYM